MSFLQLRSKFFKNPLASAQAPTAFVALTGTITTSATEADIVAGGETIILTLTNYTWVGPGAAFDAQITAIISGMDSDDDMASTGWTELVQGNLDSSAVVRTSDTVVTITLHAFPTFDISGTETITVTVPASALTGGVALLATPTFTVAATGGATAVKDILGMGLVAFAR